MGKCKSNKEPAAAKGRQAEEYTAALLAKNGYTIMGRNYHSIYGEIDIIASCGEFICFVEVKARKSRAMVDAASSVTRAKQLKIIKTAFCWLDEFACDLQPRFDVCAITIDKDCAVINTDYIAAAFDGSVYNNGM